MADQDTQNRLQAELGSLQDEWDKVQSLLGRRMELTRTVAKVGGVSPSSTFIRLNVDELNV